MASLTHVCMWQNNGWKNITADEAARLHPGGGVSAHSGLFMCELCGQYVLLTDGNYQRRHFRHSSAEKSKDCPERTTAAYVPMVYGISDHELPLRIKNVTKDYFEFEWDSFLCQITCFQEIIKLLLNQQIMEGIVISIQVKD